jgi:hypothetical protein
MGSTAMNHHISSRGWLSARLAPTLIAIAVLGMAGCDATGNRKESSDNLKNIVLAMHNYHDVFNSFPAAGGADGKDAPGISWRARLPGFYEGLQVPGHKRGDSPASDWQ